MKSLSQSEYGELRSLYQQVYVSPEVEITEELIDEIFDELLDELVEEGYEQEEAIEILDEAIDDYLAEGYYDSAVSGSKKNAAALDRAARQKRRAGQAKYYKRKAGEAVKRGKELAGAAKAGASLAKDFAGDELRRAGRAGKQAVVGAAQKKKEQVKKGVKGLIGRGLRKAAGAVEKVASKASTAAARLGEEAVGEGIDFKGAAREQARRDAIQAEKDKKSPSSKQRRLALGKFRPGASAEERAEGGRDAMREKGTSPTKNGKKMFEELQATGLFTEKEIQALIDAE
jgi:hypothetical protein